MHFKELVAVIFLPGKRHTRYFIVLVFYYVYRVLWVAKVNVTIKATDLKLANMIRASGHYMCVTLCTVQRAFVVRNNKVFCWHKHGARTVHGWVIVNFSECGAGKRQAKQKLFCFCAILGHYFKELVIHVLLDALCLCDCIRGCNAPYACFYRAASRKNFLNGLCLKTNNRLGQ